MKLSGNKILITGGNKGIGFALAEKFLALNNGVIAIGRNKNDLEKAKSQLPELIIYKADLARESDRLDLEVYIKKEHSDLNVLINNAGIQHNYNFLEGEHLEEKIKTESEINFVVPMLLTASLLPVLESNENAAIVNVSSALGIVPKVSAPVYSATKSGLHIFSRALRKQLAQTKVFELIPALVDTQMTEGRGKGKILPQVLADEFIKAFEHDKFEVNIGKVKLLRILHGIWPRLAHNIINPKNLAAL